MDRLADAADETAEEWLRSDALSELRTALERAATSLPDEYQISLDISLRVFDNERGEFVDLLKHELCFSSDVQPYEASGTSSPHRCIVDGEP